MTIKEIQEEIIDEFNLFDDWMERYEYLIELGKSLDGLDARIIRQICRELYIKTAIGF